MFKCENHRRIFWTYHVPKISTMLPTRVSQGYNNTKDWDQDDYYREGHVILQSNLLCVWRSCSESKLLLCHKREKNHIKAHIAYHRRSHLQKPITSAPIRIGHSKGDPQVGGWWRVVSLDSIIGETLSETCCFIFLIYMGRFLDVILSLLFHF